jgi:hypothetical protein
MIRDFSLFHTVQTGFETLPESYTMGTGALSSRIKRLWGEADHLPPTCTKVELYLHS